VGVTQGISPEFKPQHHKKKKKRQYLAQAGLKLTILLPLLPECWDYRPVPPFLPPLSFFLPPVISPSLTFLGGGQGASNHTSQPALPFTPASVTETKKASRD
jgi:hypothetical protein